MKNPDSSGKSGPKTLTGEAGGIYLFSDEPAARAYIEKHTERLRGFGIAEASSCSMKH